MRKFRDLMESKDTVVFAYGRFNPPTTGHEKLIQKVVSVAGTNDYRIYPSHSQNPKRDPLPQALKTAYMRKMFKKYARNIIVTKSKNAIEIAVELYDQGYKNLVMVAGSDRVKVFDAMLNNYNGVEGKAHGYYKFDSIKIVSAGERDPDSEGVEGMSASKMRVAASNGDMDSFLQGVPSGFSDGKKLYRDVRKYMGVREERDMGDMTDFETLRDAYLTGKIWNVGDVVEANGAVGEVVRKGTNYLSFVDEDGKVHKAWLHEINEGVKDLPPHLQKLVKQLDKKEKELEKKGLKVKTFIYNPDTGKPDIELDERNYAKEYQNYQGTPEQIARRSSRNKARRIMGDKTKVGMDVGHADNDPMNNDPTNLRNEDPSKNRKEPRLRKAAKIKGKVYKPGDKPPPGGWPKMTFGTKRMPKKDKKEEVELDEYWFDTVIGKINQMTHPKSYGKMVQDYAELMKQKKYQEHPSKAASEVARSYKGTDIRGFIKYINTLVAKKILPQELKAEYEMKEARSPHQKLRDFDKSRTAAGKKPIFKDKDTKFVKMKKKGLMTIMHVPSDEIDQWKKKGYTPVNEMSFKDFVQQLQERKLSDTELKRREEIAKDLSDDNFKKKYGDRWKEVKMGVATKMAKNEQDDPCWDGYKQIGMKKKDGKKVPNCVPEELNSWGELEEAVEYQGKKVTLNKPFYTPDGPKKSAVYVTGPKDKVVIVRFGDPDMEIKVDDPERRKSFRARHNCDNPGPKWKARYWSCKAW